MRLKLIIYQDYDIAISSSPKYGINLSLSLVNNTNWLVLRLNKIKHSVICIKNLAPVSTQDTRYLIILILATEQLMLFDGGGCSLFSRARNEGSQQFHNHIEGLKCLAVLLLLRQLTSSFKDLC